MELTGKVIIFDNEEEAIIWYELIKDAMKHSKVESLRMGIEDKFGK